VPGRPGGGTLPERSCDDRRPSTRPDALVPSCAARAGVGPAMVDSARSAPAA
jgi:hypothetical protein